MNAIIWVVVNVQTIWTIFEVPEITAEPNIGKIIRKVIKKTIDISFRLSKNKGEIPTIIPLYADNKTKV